MAREHRFSGELVWSGASRGVAETYEGYSREWTFRQANVADLVGTAAVPFRGTADLRNPEDLLLASVAACHCLSFLAEATRAKVTVVSYADSCEATMTFRDGKMQIVEAVLRPVVTISAGDVAMAERLHHAAHEGCFIANSVSFPIVVIPATLTRP